MAGKKKKIKRKVRIIRKTYIVKRTSRKSNTNSDSIPRMQVRPPADNGPTFKIKIKKK